jgi:lysyl endopeptidase
VAADGDSTNARTYWLPMALGATTDLEIELPAGIGSERVSVALPSLMHMVETAPQASLNNFTSKTDCAYRTPDAMCSTPLPPAANAIAAMEFVDSDLNGLAVCTGTLLADKGATQQPYFLTAQHCINNQTEATSLATFWFWRSTACGGTLRSDYFDTTSFYRTGGATLLFTRTELTTNARNPIGTDTTLLRLNETPPAGVMFAGWSTQRQAITPSVSLIGLHQPKGQSNSFAGDILRQSTGTISGMGRISGYTNGNTDFPLVQQTNDTTQPMYQVSWSSGITEGGSSGSALFRNGTTSNPQVVGQLWGGASSCSTPTSPDFYGRFDLAYQDGLINWLNPGYKMVFRFFNINNGAHFFSANVSERDNVRNSISYLVHEGPVFSVAPAAASGLSPVYRFYNTATGVHFYTINESERASLLGYPTFNYEGVAWYAKKTSDANTVPVYRFYKRSLGTHLYTVSVAERDNLIANASGSYDFEGVAYYAWAQNLSTFLSNETEAAVQDGRFFS